MRITTIAALLLALPSLACHISMSRHSVMVLDESAFKEEEHALELAPGERVVLTTSFGRIRATAKEGASPRLHARISAGGRTPEEAQRVLERYSVNIERIAGGLRVELVEHGPHGLELGPQPVAGLGVDGPGTRGQLVDGTHV